MRIIGIDHSPSIEWLRWLLELSYTDFILSDSWCLITDCSYIRLRKELRKGRLSIIEYINTLIRIIHILHEDIRACLFECIHMQWENERVYRIPKKGKYI